MILDSNFRVRFAYINLLVVYILELYFRALVGSLPRLLVNNKEIMKYVVTLIYITGEEMSFV